VEYKAEKKTISRKEREEGGRKEEKGNLRT
jgi:hypothetical protein